MSPGSMTFRNAVQVGQRHLGRFELNAARAISMVDNNNNNSLSFAFSSDTSAAALRPTAARWYANASTMSSSDHHNSSNTSSNNRMSPFDNLFQMIQDGKTSMGTTQLHRTVPRYLECGVPEDAIRFRTRHLGRLLEAPFIEGDEHKVTLFVATHYLPLNDVEREILQQIVGPSRLTQERLQLSSAQFGSRIENKRHLISILDRVVSEAKKIAEEMKQDAAAAAAAASNNNTTTTTHEEQ